MQNVFLNLIWYTAFYKGHRSRKPAVVYIFIPFRRPLLHLQSIFKGLPGGADHVADADRLEQSGVGEFISRAMADAENILFIIPRMPEMSFTRRHSNLFGKQQILKNHRSFKPTAALWIFVD